jgi:hypothetical protein
MYDSTHNRHPTPFQIHVHASPSMNATKPWGSWHNLLLPGNPSINPTEHFHLNNARYIKNPMAAILLKRLWFCFYDAWNFDALRRAEFATKCKIQNFGLNKSFWRSTRIFLFFIFPRNFGFLPEVLDQNCFKMVANPKYRLFPKAISSGFLTTETLSSTKIYEIAIKDSEERKPGNFTKLRTNDNYCAMSSWWVRVVRLLKCFGDTLNRFSMVPGSTW